MRNIKEHKGTLYVPTKTPKNIVTSITKMFFSLLQVLIDVQVGGIFVYSKIPVPSKSFCPHLDMLLFTRLQLCGHWV